MRQAIKNAVEELKRTEWILAKSVVGDPKVYDAILKIREVIQHLEEGETLTPTKMAQRNWDVFREGEAANDHNHRVLRQRKGERQNCPYEPGTPEYKEWNAGYQYRDMVNDG